MRKHQSLRYLLIFILAQMAWLTLLGLWIYRYLSVYYAETGNALPHPLLSARANVTALVGGLVLLVAVSVGMSLLFARLNSQLKTARMYDDFIANVTHELKSPLASIQLVLETLSEREVSAAQRKKFLALMMRDAGRLNNLISSILKIAGLGQKNVAHHFEILSADPVVRGLLRESADQFKLPARAVRIEGRAACRVVVDRNALKIVFNNFIDNAIKYSTGRPRIEVRYGCSRQTLSVAFTDHGIGIASKDQKRVFDKFLRLSGPEIPNVRGTGLGLYWVREIMKIHGGRVSVSSRGTRRGSTFTIEMPVYRASGRRLARRLMKLTRAGGARVNFGEGGRHAEKG
ncbi:MAG: HAMP domain-containing sensor histidine kinase [bacterium]|nr:HAMP domain-containing sensor histidine kinase [bacterium]